MERICSLARWVALVTVLGVAAGLAMKLEWRSLTITDLFWQGIVPLVPLMLLLMPHLWRGICPVALLNLVGARLARGNRPTGPNFLPRETYRWIKLHGVVLGATILWMLVPLRLLLFNQSAWATLALVGAIIVAAVAMGLATPWKAGWCSSLCPVYPVEKLYGAAPLWTLRDPRCVPANSPESCYRCALHCLDVPLGEEKYWTAMGKAPTYPFAEAVHNFFLGSFPGFVLAYLLLNNFANLTQPGKLRTIGFVYGTFLAMMLASYACYRIAQVLLAANHAEESAGQRRQRLDLVVIFMAVNLYYMVGGVGIAKVVSILGGWQSAQLAIAAGILSAVLVVSLIWLRRGWNARTAPWAQW